MFARFTHKRFKDLDWVGYVHDHKGDIFVRKARETKTGPVVPEDAKTIPGVKLTRLMQSGHWLIDEFDSPGVPGDLVVGNSAQGAAKATKAAKESVR